MNTLNHKIDFAVVIAVSNANPNGDPLNGNRPRENFDGFGEMSDVCLKRKIRNRLQDLGERIFVQSDDRADDGFPSLRERASACEELKKAEDPGKKKDELKEMYRDLFANPYNAARKGYIDDVIEPASTRLRLAKALEMLAAKHDSNPVKKHGNIPL